MWLLLKSAQSRTAKYPPPSKDPTEEQTETIQCKLDAGKTGRGWDSRPSENRVLTGAHTSPCSLPVRRKSILETVLPILCRRPRNCWIPQPLPWVLPIRTQPNELSSPRAAPMKWSAAPWTVPIPPAASLSQTRGLWPFKQGSSKFIRASLNPSRIWPLTARGMTCCPSEMSMCTVKSPH